MPARDYYAILGIPHTASEKEVKQAFRRLARRFHPDVNPGNPEAERHFKEINEAHEVLGDPEKRRKYDKYGDQWQHADRLEEMQRQSGFAGRWGPGMGNGPRVEFGAGDLGDIFERFFGGAESDAPGPRAAPGYGRAAFSRDVEAAAEITLEEAYHGATRMVDVGGRRLEVRIPPGVDTGSRVRIPGAGAAARTGRGGRSAGDLYINVTLVPHAAFQRKGDDLYTEVSIPLMDALLGGEGQVPTLRGAKLALRVPPETQNGKTFRLAGQGMPHLEGTGHGDLYVQVRVVLPSSLTPRERQLLEELRALRPSG